MNVSIVHLVATIVSFCLAACLTPLVREFAKRNAMLDLPNQRSSHTIPVPRMGGVAIVIAALIGAIIAAQYIDGWMVLLGLGAILLGTLGFIDDTRALSAAPKYLTQLGAAVIAVLALEPSLEISLPPIEFQFSTLLSYSISIVWITAFINAYNFIDGLDGLSAGVGIIGIIGIMAVGNGFASFLLMPLAGALLGFLIWNLSPASIFMGDAGSQFVGFILAVGMLGPKGERIDFILALIIFAPVIFDTGLTLVRRAIGGKDIFSAHREHLYQRLSQQGISHRTVANIFYTLTAISVLAAIGYMHESGPQRILYPVTLVIALVGFAVLVTAIDRGLFPRPGRNSTGDVVGDVE